MKLKEIAIRIIAERAKYQSLIFNHRLQESLFRNSLNEEADTDKREDVLQKISNGDWEEPQNPKSFKDSMDISKHKEMLTPYSTGELSKMKLYKLNGYNIGFALKKKNGGYKEIVAVHNNESDVKNVGKELMKSAIKNGGCYLDHFDGYLSSFYDSLGFEEIDRDKFDAQYDQDGSFRNKYGESDVIYRKHKNCK
jgi:hypothetical protein